MRRHTRYSSVTGVQTCALPISPLFFPGFRAFLRQFPLGLGAAHGAEDVDLLFVADKPFPKLLRPQKTDVATGAGGAFGPHLVSPFGHISISLGSLRFATRPTRGPTPFFVKLITAGKGGKEAEAADYPRLHPPQ